MSLNYEKILEKADRPGTNGVASRVLLRWCKGTKRAQTGEFSTMRCSNLQCNAFALQYKRSTANVRLQTFACDASAVRTYTTTRRTTLMLLGKWLILNGKKGDIWAICAEAAILKTTTICLLWKSYWCLLLLADTSKSGVRPRVCYSWKSPLFLRETRVSARLARGATARAMSRLFHDRWQWHGIPVLSFTFFSNLKNIF